MPKMKTHSGAKKRYKVTGSGKILRRNGTLTHTREKRPRGRKRRLAGTTELPGGDRTRARRQLGL